MRGITVQVVGDPDHGRSVRSGLCDFSVQQIQRATVKSGARFVQQQNARRLEQDACEIQTLGHPPGKGAGPFLGKTAQFHPLQ